MRINRYIKLAILLSVGIILSVVDSFFILPINVIGAKFGIANVISLYALYTFTIYEAIILSVLRAVLGSLLYGGINAVMYSLAGSLLSITFMILAKKIKAFSIYGVSLVGSIANNVGQILIASFYLSSFSPIYYLPYLCLFGTITSLLVAYLAKLLLKAKF